MYQIERRHLSGYGSETKWVIFDIDTHKTLEKYYDTKKQAEKALNRLLSREWRTAQKGKEQ